MIHDELRARNRRGNRLRLWEAEVLGTAEVAARTVRVTLGGTDGFADGALPADAIKLALPAVPGERPWITGTFPNLELGAVRPAWRPYTVRRHTSTSLDLDVVLHGDGPGAHWARTARPGDRIQFTGPRSEFWACPDVDSHLLIGDATAVPGALAILESLPGAAVALLPGDGERTADPRVTWTDDPLADLPAIEGRVQAWVAGEAFLVRDVRRSLLAAGVARGDLHATGYWRRGMTVSQTDAGRLEVFVAGAHEDHHDIDLVDV